MDLPAAIEKYWGQVLGGAAALAWSVDRVLAQRNKSRDAAVALSAARAVAKLDLTKLAQEAAAGIILTLREEVDHWTGEVEKLRQEIHDIQRDHAKTLADKDAQITLLQGRVRQLEATIAAHRRQMIAADLPLPPEPAFFELDAGELRTQGER